MSPKFQVDIPINARVTAIQSFQNLHSFIRIAVAMLVGGQKNAHQPIFPYSIIEKSPASLAHDSIFVDRNKSKFGTKARCMVQRTISKFGKFIIICIIMFLMTSYANHQQKLKENSGKARIRVGFRSCKEMIYFSLKECFSCYHYK